MTSVRTPPSENPPYKRVRSHAKEACRHSVAEANILVETTGRKRDRSFAYRAYLECLRTGTELDSGG
ncbi:hypothetical protein MES5069_360145 [Mesorhizobium escarrei]|uniref:DUF982 domain-containing protein n=1 Tax=Mesorhizobium escarrei TaxID=666018 RepID=A0ABM9E1Y2_9HYPH|nr:hypothetical protein MES5069_360145 [Mesorhizobium escarrei]